MKQNVVYSVRFLAISFTAVLLLLLAAVVSAAPAVSSWAGNKIDSHEVWDPDSAVLDYVPGQPKGYTEGDTAAFRVEIDGATNGEELKFMVCLDLDDSGAYAFTTIEPWDTTFTPDPPPSIPLDSSLEGFGAQNGTITNVDFLGEAGSHDGQDCPDNYLGWLVEFTVTDASQQTYIVYGGHIATPGDEFITSPGGTPQTVPDLQGASNASGVFQARVVSQGQGDKTINFQPNDITDPTAISLADLSAAGTTSMLLPAGLLLLAALASLGVARRR